MRYLAWLVFFILTHHPFIFPMQTVPGGELRVAGGDDTGSLCPLEHTDVKAEIVGNVARVEVTQVFHNPHDRTIEAVYVFPLPNKAAVYDMEIVIADRTVRGVVLERDEARSRYETAKKQGHLAALLDQERPNIFTQSLANIRPGDEVRVRIRYFETLQLESTSYEFVFPMVVGPRFIAGEPVRAGKRGWSPDTTEVPDASRITPPVLKPGERSGHDISLSLTLDAGGPLADLTSPTHRIDTVLDGEEPARIQLRQDDRIPNKDFVLRYRLDNVAPQVIFRTHRPEGEAEGEGEDGYFMLLVEPDASPPPQQIRRKEIIFVVDCSGSMSGEPIQKVREAMGFALENLNAGDTFQIIRFSYNAEKLARRPLPVTPTNIEEGLRYVSTLEGNGGTIMLAGVEAAVLSPRDPDRLRIIAFMTDGYIGNERAILSYLKTNLGEARLFSFGVGGSVNRYLLDKMAEIGRGAVEYVLPREEGAASVARFYDRIRNPYLTDVRIDWGGLPVLDVYPRRTPDLFLGQPLLIHGRYRTPGVGFITLHAKRGDENYMQHVVVELPRRRAEGEVMAKLWARARIEDLSNRELDELLIDFKREITEVALAHQLVSKYTSFVAVEERVSTDGEEPVLVEVPVHMPEGVSYEGVFGPGGGMGFGNVEMIECMGPGSVFTHLVLTVILLYAFGATLDRWVVHGRTAKQSRRFKKEVGELLLAGKFGEVLELARSKRRQLGHVPAVFRAGLTAFEETSGDLNLRLVAARQSMRRAGNASLESLRKGIRGLLGVAITAPMIGVIGTMVGLLNAFQGYSLAGGGGLGAISAGIAEAITATAFGLFVAIPSSWAYVHFRTRVRRFEMEIEESRAELVNALCSHRPL
jgi:Ca-activated chloride channel family protein